MKTHLLCLSLFGLAAAGSAATLSPEAALQRALSASPGLTRSHGAKPLELKITARTEGVASVYLFSKGEGNGFVALSADDATVPVLGYSDSGTLPADFSALPDGMRYWIASLGEQSQQNKTFYRPVASATRKAIAPMTETRWNQNAPYNNDCPEIGTKRCYTGCVATAMAQVLKYYNYPAQGSGTHSYTWNYTNTSGSAASQTLTYDYGSATFDWDEMLNTYGEDATQAQKDAVANLMYACGVSVNMIYGTNESGAVSFDMIPALADNFNYDKGLQYHARAYYGLNDWETLVYNNLANYGPVLYGGQSNDGGHQFVCDGYDGNGYFHFNWGWGGMSDGYFLLTALNPESQGIGGSTSGYDFQQDIVTNLSPTQTSANYYEQLLWEGDFSIVTASTTLGGSVNYTGSFYNASSGTVKNLQIGIMLTPTDGGSPVFVKYSSFTSLNPLRGLNDGNFYVTLPKTLASGTYTVQPAFKSAVSDLTPIQVPINNIGSYVMTVDGNNVTFSADEPATVSADDFQLESEVYENMPFKVTATLTDNSADKEYYGNLIVAFISGGRLSAMGELSAVDLEPGESRQWEYVSSLQSASTYSILKTDVAYQMYLCVEANSDLQPIAGPINVTIYPASDPQLSVGSFNIEDGQNPSHIQATATVGCESGYFAGSLTLAVFPPSGGSAIGQYSSEFFTVSGTSPTQSPDLRRANQANIAFNFNLADGELDTDYMAVLYSGQTQVSNPVQFHTAVKAGISGTPADGNEVTQRTYWSLTGVCMGTSKPAPGIYLARDLHADGTYTTSRTLVR